MLNDKVMKVSFILSLLGHCLLLSAPGLRLPSKNNIERDMSVRLKIKEPFLLPEMNELGPEKKVPKIKKNFVSAEPVLEKQEEKPKKLSTDNKRHTPMNKIAKHIPYKDMAIKKVDSLDSSKESMLRYQDIIKQRIQSARRYPLWAKKNGLEGIADISFVVYSSGLSDNIKLLHSTGSKILDKEALSTIKRAGPFPPIPTKNISQTQIQVSIVFELN